MTNTLYSIHRQIGNFAEVVFQSHNYYEIQDYILNEYAKQRESEGLDPYPDDEADFQLFCSYYTITETKQQE